MSWKACAFVKELRVNITQTEKFVLLLLAECHNNVHKIAWPSVKSLAEDALLSERQTTRVLANLESKGFIRRSKPMGGHITTCYEILGMEGCQNVIPKNELGVTFEASRGDIRGDISDSVIRKEPVLEPENRLILSPPSSESGSKVSKKKTDERHSPFRKTLEKFWAYQNPDDAAPNWSAADAGQLAKFLKDWPTLSKDSFTQWLRNYDNSEGINTSLRSYQILPRLHEYSQGPLNQFKKPLEANHASA